MKPPKLNSILLILFIACIWEAITQLNIVNSPLFPPLSTVISTLFHLLISREFIIAYFTTFKRVIIGFSLGVFIGIILGILLSYFKTLREAFYPILAFIAVIPVLALLPLLMVWIGINELLPIFMVFLCSSIPVIFNTLSGLKSIDPELVKIAKVLGASDLEVTYTILLPLSLPSILSALKIEAAMSWKTCFITEMLALSSGLGYYMLVAETTLRVDILLASILILALSCYIFYLIFESIENRVLKIWGYT